MQSYWVLVFTFIAIGHAFDDFEGSNSIDFEDYNALKRPATILIPRSRLLFSGDELPFENLPSRILKRRAAQDDGFTKRATASDRLAAIPRSGLMISGRGWMPGFVDSPRIFKRSVPLEKILLRPMPVA